MRVKIFSVLITAMALLFFNSVAAFADTITYPFDSITIVSAYRFEVICDETPDVSSYLYGHVNSGEKIFVYAGDIILSSEFNNSPSNIVIITNEADEDICAWIINSYSNNPEVKETFSFSSHITIDPVVGVIKNLNDFTYQAVIEKTSSNECTFTAQNWVGTISHTYTMVADSYVEETELNIVISAYGGI